MTLLALGARADSALGGKTGAVCVAAWTGVASAGAGQSTRASTTKPSTSPAPSKATNTGVLTLLPSTEALITPTKVTPSRHPTKRACAAASPPMRMPKLTCAKPKAVALTVHASRATANAGRPGCHSAAAHTAAKPRASTKASTQTRVNQATRPWLCHASTWRPNHGSTTASNPRTASKSPPTVATETPKPPARCCGNSTYNGMLTKARLQAKTP